MAQREAEGSSLLLAGLCVKQQRLRSPMYILHRPRRRLMTSEAFLLCPVLPPFRRTDGISTMTLVFSMAFFGRMPPEALRLTHPMRLTGQHEDGCDCCMAHVQMRTTDNIGSPMASKSICSSACVYLTFQTSYPGHQGSTINVL